MEPIKLEFIFNPNFKQTGFETIDKIYVVDKDGNKRELPEKFIIRLPKEKK